MGRQKTAVIRLTHLEINQIIDVAEFQRDFERQDLRWYVRLCKLVNREFQSTIEHELKHSKDLLMTIDKDLSDCETKLQSIHRLHGVTEQRKTIKEDIKNLRQDKRWTIQDLKFSQKVYDDVIPCPLKKS